MSDREALAAALDPALRSYGWLGVLEAAARERLAQLPEQCEHGFNEPHSWTPFDCSGKAYPTETVDRMMTAAFEFDRVDPPGTRGRYERLIFALLDVLTEESEKVA